MRSTVPTTSAFCVLSGSDGPGVSAWVGLPLPQIAIATIVTRAVWEKTHDVLRQKSKAPERQEDMALFGGMIWCQCGQKLKWIAESGKLDCPGCYAKIPAKDLESIFVEDFFDLTASHPNLAPAMSASSEHRESQAELVGIQIALQEARTRRNGVEGMLAGASITQQRFEELHPLVEREVRQLETKVQALHLAAQARRKMPHQRPQPGEAKRAGSPERTEPFQPAGGQQEPAKTRCPEGSAACFVESLMNYLSGKV